MDAGAVQGNPRGWPDRQLVRTSQQGLPLLRDLWRGTAKQPGAGLQCGWAIAMYTAAHPATVMIAAVAHPATVASGPLR